MTEDFIYQIYTDTGGEYDRAVVTDGDVMVEVRLSEGHTAHIQTDNVTARDGADTGDAISRVREFVAGRLAEEDSTYIV